MQSKQIDELSKDELIRIVKRYRKIKYGLIWEDKPELVANRCVSELPVLVEIEDLEIKNTTRNNSPVNLLIEGDNYHALYALNFTHKKSVDFIYIDPPYNTGAKDWKYNNSYVDASDPYRHSKWLSFMDKRLRVSKNLLKDDGIICVTVDDYEAPRLWMLLENIFGEQNHLGTVVIRNNPKGRKTERKVSLIHEYAIFFGRTNKAKMKKNAIEIEDKSHKYKADSDGNWYLEVNLRKQGVDSNAVNRKGKRSERYYPIYVDPESGRISVKEKLPIKVLPIDPNGIERIWRRAKNVIEEMYANGDIFYKKTRFGHQVYYKFYGGLNGEPFESIWTDSVYSASEYGTKELQKLLGKRESFPYPKSPYAVMECIKAATDNPDAIILDYFAGSGTTAQAVLELNAEMKVNMQFIICTNNENNICKDVCYPRIHNVIKGYGHGELPARMKYFITDFVPKVVTDQDRRELVYRSSELLCIAESTYTLSNDSYPQFRLYLSDIKATLIIYDETCVSESINSLVNVPGEIPVSVYVFSYNGEFDEDDFSEIKHRYNVKPIPEAILNQYRRIRIGRGNQQ